MRKFEHVKKRLPVYVLSTQLGEEANPNPSSMPKSLTYETGQASTLSRPANSCPLFVDEESISKRLLKKETFWQLQKQFKAKLGSFGVQKSESRA